MISYDTNILIYALEGTSPFATAAKTVIQQGEQDGAVLSVLVWQELMTGAVMQGKGIDAKVALALSELNITRFVPVSKDICKQSVALTRQYGKKIYGYDAIHLATAIEQKADVFITNDKMLLSLNIDELPIQGLNT
jgi:predicted nucleic acid-binding protein